jgi:hypothetical protein
MIGYANAFQNNDRAITFNIRKIVKYIEDCHLPDGGYFFAKVEPSSGLETYLAAKTLKLLGVKTKNVKSIASFWEQVEFEGNLDNLFTIFLAVETYKELGLWVGVFKKCREFLVDYYKHIIPRGAFFYSENKRLSGKGFWSAMSYFSTIGKELEDLFYLVTLNQDLKIKIINKEKIIKLIISLQNKNGGFGRGRESHLMATYHALAILKLLSFDLPTKEKVYSYLVERWDDCDFLEDLFYIVESLALIRKPLPEVGKIIQFVDSCQRGNGGFGRAPVMSIPTIEDTYLAVSIIKTCENYFDKKFLR